MLKHKAGVLSCIILLIGISLTTVIWWNIKQDAVNHLRVEFNFSADKTANIIRNRLDNYALVMHSLKGFFEGSEYISASEFRTFVQALNLDHKTGIQGIGLVNIIAHADKQRHIAAIQKEGFPQYQIKPEGQRERYAPIMRMEPSTGDNSKALGFDVLTVPTARVAMEQARDKGDIVITPRLTLVQDKDKIGVFGFVLYLPLYQSHARLESIADRRAAIVGWADVPFRMNDLMAGLAEVLDPDIDLEIHDGEPSEKTRMYRSNSEQPTTKSAHPSLQTRRQLDIGGRRWTLLLSTTPAFEARLSNWQYPVIVGLSGIALSILLSWLMWLLVKGREQAQLYYRQLFNQAGDGVLIFDNKQSVFDANPAALQLFGYDHAELMQLSVANLLANQKDTGQLSEKNLMLPSTLHLEEHRYVRKDGSEFTAEVNIRSLDNAMYFVVLRDLTERKKAEQRIQRLTHLYQALTEVNQAIIRMTDETELFPLVCRCAVNFGGMKMAWVGQLNPADDHIMPVASYGSGIDYIKELNISANADSPQGKDPIGTALRENRPIIDNDYLALAEDVPSSWYELAEQFAWASVAAFPIQRDDKPFAVLNVYHDQIAVFDEETKQLFEEMTNDISFALANFDRETQRKNAIASLAESENKLSIILENVGAYIFLKDAKGRYLFANKKVLDLWGKTEAEVVGMGDEQFFDAESTAQIRKNDQQVLIEGKTITCEETNLVTENGQSATYWTVKLPLRRLDGSIYALCGISTDITEQKRIEQELYESQEKLSLFIQYAPAALAMFDCDMRYLAVSRRWLVDYQIGDNDIVGQSHYEVFPEIPERWKEIHQRVMAGEILRSDEDLFTRADGSEQWLRWEVRPWYRQDNTIGGIVIFSEDITQYKQMLRIVSEKEQMLSESQRIAHIGSWRLDLTNDTFTWSNETYRIYQIDPENFDHTLAGYMTLLHPEDRPLMENWIARCRNNQKPGALEFRILSSSNGIRTLEAHAIIKYDASHNLSCIEGTVQDISRRILAEQQLRLTAKVFEASQEGIVITDANNAIISANPAYARISGYSLEEALGKNPRLVSSGKHDKSFYHSIWNDIHHKNFWQGEVINRRKSGKIYPQWLSISVIRNLNGEITHHIGILSDLTEHKSAQDRIQFLSNFDTLTHLPNKALLGDRTKLALATARREKTKLVLMFLDIDRFNIVNDSLGPAIGDKLLQAFADRLTDHLHADDTLSRHGSDEFNLLLLNTDADGAAHVAQKLLTLIAQPFTIADRVLNLTASIGVAEYPQDGETFEQLLQSADAALFRAKQKGRNNFQFFTTQLHERATQVLQIENELRQALERGELILHYQPQVNTKTLEIVGAEALIRWQHPQKGLVSPGLFIPIAEESDLIIEIGNWVLNTAANQLAEWQKSAIDIVPVAVNLSFKQFRQHTFYQTVAQVIRQYKLDPALLELELTEGIAMENTEKTIKIVEKLHQLGVQLSIDDFGTGYSSLSYLRQFKIDKLKIDQSFVRNLGRSPKDSALIIAIIQMAKSLGFQTIAEGVETQQQLDFLKENDSDQIQGYWYSKPLPAEAFITLLTSKNSASN
jgi:diguanylate cyclase (GGDEF)-like protein/PAS domain S-box-containing protein